METDRQSNHKRRPLPTPNASPSPDALHTSSAAPVPTAKFYGDPPPPPPRPAQKGPGSTHTGYHYIPSYQPAEVKAPSPPPYDPPPFTSTLSDAKWRSPELVQEVDARDDDIPDLVSAEEPVWGGSMRDDIPAFQNLNDWSPGDSGDRGWESVQHAQSGINIDGCDATEELQWWDSDVQLRAARPGPGVLPTLLSQKLHDSDHSLFTVTVNPPDILIHPRSGSPSSSQSTFHPPTSEEVHEAVPHPNALYCRKENGWILLLRRSSSELPPLAASFQKAHPGVLFPHSSRRKMNNSCLNGIGEDLSSRPNLTHHFHCYPAAVSSLSLNPSFSKASWEERVPLLPGHLQPIPEEGENQMEGIEPTTLHVDDAEGILLHLYVCCQCSVYVLCSDLIPGIVPARHFDDLARERADNPMPGQSGSDAAIVALDTTMKYEKFALLYTTSYASTES